MVPEQEAPQEEIREAPRKRKPPVKCDVASPSPPSQPPTKIPKAAEDELQEPPKPVPPVEAPTEVNDLPEPPASQPRPEDFWQDRQEFEDSPTITRHDSQGTLVSLN